MVKKRKDYIDWDAYFMGIAMLSAQRSKDPSTQVGACVVSQDNKILCVGYNGAPNGYEDDNFPWEREGDFVDTKYAYICHAELNAILNSKGSNLEGAKIYVDLLPCNECAKAIIQAGIKEVIYKSDNNPALEKAFIVTRKLFDGCNVKCTKYEPRNKEITIKV